jgi:biotin carboxylase
VKTVLFVGAGRHQRRAIGRAKELGLRVAAIDRNPDAPGLTDADVTGVVDFANVGAAVEAARALRPDGVLTIASDRAVPVVAAIADALGLPGISAETARRATSKVAMRLALADAGVPQPRFAPARASASVRRWRRSGCRRW